MQVFIIGHAQPYYAKQLEHQLSCVFSDVLTQHSLPLTGDTLPAAVHFISESDLVVFDARAEPTEEQVWLLGVCVGASLPVIAVGDTLSGILADAVITVVPDLNPLLRQLAAALPDAEACASFLTELNLKYRESRRVATG